MARCVLYVEDSRDDIVLLEHAMRRAGVEHHMSVAKDGREAIDYLEGRGKFGDRDSYPLPDLVILDWKLPLVSGAEVLKWIRDQPDFRRLGVVVFSYSAWQEAVREAFDAGANGYFVKPSSFEATVNFALGLTAVLAGLGAAGPRSVL